MPPKMRLPKVQNIDLKQVQKEQIELQKKKKRKYKTKIDAPLRDSRGRDPSKYIIDDSPDNLIGYTADFGNPFPPQYQPSGTNFRNDHHSFVDDFSDLSMSYENFDQPSFQNFEPQTFAEPKTSRSTEGVYEFKPSQFFGSTVPNEPNTINIIPDNQLFNEPINLDKKTATKNTRSAKKKQMKKEPKKKKKIIEPVTAEEEKNWDQVLEDKLNNKRKLASDAKDLNKGPKKKQNTTKTSGEKRKRLELRKVDPIQKKKLKEKK